MRHLITAATFVGLILAGLSAGIGQAGAAVEPGLYRACPVALNIPGTYACRTLTMKQYIGEVRRVQVLGSGYGPLISTPYGGYMEYYSFGKKYDGRIVLRRNATGYDVKASSPTGPFYSTLKMTKIR